jgi:hypothetical protein
VGVLYAELDEWNAKIAELKTKTEGTPEARASAAKARTQAAESSTAVRGENNISDEFNPSSGLRSLYREVAKPTQTSPLIKQTVGRGTS